MNKNMTYTMVALTVLAVAGAVTQVSDTTVKVNPSTGTAYSWVKSQDAGSVLRIDGAGQKDAMIWFENASNTLWQIHEDWSQGQRLEFTNQSGSTQYVMWLEQGGDVWVAGDMSALSFTDRTVGPSNSVKALDELKNVRTTTDCEGRKCEIDKSTLPTEMVKEYMDEKTNTTKKARDLTYTVSWLIKANQELLARVEALETEVERLK